MEQEVWRSQNEHLFPTVFSADIFSKDLVFFKLMEWVSGTINYNIR